MVAVGLKSADAGTSSDAEFIELIQSNHWAFFRDHQNPQNGLWRANGDNRWPTENQWSCSAGNGFGIASLVVAAYRGWIPEEEAYRRILRLLKTYQRVERSWDGFFRHWYVYADGSTPDAGSEISTIDSSWFISGALLAAQFFRGTELDRLANELYEGMGYDTGFNPWDWPYCEYIIMNILGSGSPTHPLAHPHDTIDAWNAKIWPVTECPLFWHQWPQAYVDFRYRPDSRGINFFDEARGRTLQHRQKCIELHQQDPERYNDYGPDCWGLTAAEASTGYIAMHPFGGEWMCDSGSVCPIALPSAMVHVPFEARAAMRYICQVYSKIDAFSVYGFMQTFNTGEANSGSPFFSHRVPSADIGCAVVVIENFRSGMPWKYFMRHPAVQRGMNLLGMPQSIWIPYHDDWNDGADPNAWGGNTSFENTDGTDPSADYVTIPTHNPWVGGYARRLVADGPGDIVRFQLNEADQSAADLLSFWFRADTEDVSLGVGLRDAEGHETVLPLADYFDDGVVPTGWTRIRIPLKRYAVSGDPDTDVRLTFLGDVAFRFYSPGTVFIEDLAFVGDDLPPPPPSTFGAACVSGRVRLRWGWSPHDDVVGYRLWRRGGMTQGFYTVFTDLLSAIHTVEDRSAEFAVGTTFYYAVQCQDRCGNAGTFSSGVYERCVQVSMASDVDFGDGRTPNTFGGDDGSWGGATVTFVPTNGPGGRPEWVRLIAAPAGGGAFTLLNGADLRPFDGITCRVMATGGLSSVKLGLKSTDGVERKLAIVPYIRETATWDRIVIPFTDFAGVDLSSIENVSFTLPSGGTLLVQGLRFIRRTDMMENRWTREGEDADEFNGGSPDDLKEYAWCGKVLGDSWGNDQGEFASWNILVTQVLNEAYLDVRYACADPRGARLEVWVNSNYCGTLNLGATGGWGDQPHHFDLACLRLGRITDTYFSVKLAAGSNGAPVNLDRITVRSSGAWFREAEDWDAQSGSDGTDWKPGASGGKVLGAGWGGQDGDFAFYDNIVLDSTISNAVFRMRYGQGWQDGRLLRVELDGTNVGYVACGNTGGWLDHWCQGEVVELPLGTISAGNHSLRLVAEGNDEDVNLDWLSISPADVPCPRPADTDGDGLVDRDEALFGTLVDNPDSDADGITDGAEVCRTNGWVTSPTDHDSDDDGMNDGDEITAGTSPTDASSLFRFVESHTEPDGVRLRWPGSPAATYRILYCDGPHWYTGSFRRITNPEAIRFTNGFVEYLDDGSGTFPAPGSTGTRVRIYRLEAGPE